MVYSPPSFSALHTGASILVASAIAATPAYAAGIHIDAPGNLVMFALGVSGLLLGRLISRRRKAFVPDEPEQPDSDESG